MSAPPLETMMGLHQELRISDDDDAMPAFRRGRRAAGACKVLPAKNAGVAKEGRRLDTLESTVRVLIFTGRARRRARRSRLHGTCGCFPSFFARRIRRVGHAQQGRGLGAEAPDALVLSLVSLDPSDGLVVPLASPDLLAHPPVRPWPGRTSRWDHRPRRSCIDFSSGSMAAFQSPSRYCATPRVVQ